jgi:galactose-1-phosphate uridylyltransferase
MWEYLKQRYEHNWALEVTLLERHHVLRQQDMSIQEFYNAFTRVTWQLDCMMPKPCHACDCSEAREKFNQKFHLMDFLVRLRPEFESTVAELVARPMLPTMDEALSALIIAEISLSAARTQTVCPHCKRCGHPAEHR